MFCHDGQVQWEKCRALQNVSDVDSVYFKNVLLV